MKLTPLLLITSLLYSCSTPTYRTKTTTTYRYAYPQSLKAPFKPVLHKTKAIGKGRAKINCKVILANINKCSL